MGIRKRMMRVKKNVGHNVGGQGRGIEFRRSLGMRVNVIKNIIYKILNKIKEWTNI